ncbi:MAG: T9SS type A sorting domain-containing protein [Sphingobacteriales bacterium]|nr:MAG: T9SS type A sorting domain-containing protein [Sphingobacteriales bacterium]
MAGLLTCSLVTTVTAQPVVKSFLINNDIKNYAIEKSNNPNFDLLMAGTSFNNGPGGRNQIHFIRTSQNGTPAVWKYYYEAGTGYVDERCADIAVDPNEPNAAYITSLVRHYPAPGIGQDRIKVYKIDINTGNIMHENIIEASGDYSNAYPNHTIVQDGILYICGYNTPETSTSLPVTSPTYIPTAWGWTGRMAKKAMVLRYDPAGPGTVTHAAHFDYYYVSGTGFGFPNNYVATTPPAPINNFLAGDFDMATRMTMLSNGKLHVTGMANLMGSINRYDYQPYNFVEDGVLNLVLDPADLTIIADAPFGQEGGGFGVGIVESYGNGQDMGYYILTNSLNQEILGPGGGPEPDDAGGYNPLVSGASAVYIRASGDPDHPYEPFYNWNSSINHDASGSLPQTKGFIFFSPPTTPNSYADLTGDLTRYWQDCQSRIYFGGDARSPRWFLNALQKRHDYTINSDPDNQAVFWAAGLTDNKDALCSYGTYFPSQDNINPFVGKMNIFMNNMPPVPYITMPQIDRVSYDHFVTYPSQQGTGISTMYTNAFRYKGGGLSNIGWNCEFALQDNTNGPGSGDIFLSAPVMGASGNLNLKFIHANTADASLLDGSGKSICAYMDCALDYRTGPVWFPEGIECKLQSGSHSRPSIYTTSSPVTRDDVGMPVVRGCIDPGFPPFYKPSGIQDNTKDADMGAELYPNPAAGYVNLKLNGEVDGAMAVRVEMSNILGQGVHTLYSGNATGIATGGQRLELPAVTPGVYMVRVFANGRLLHQQRLSVTK